jgi:hypothetical protein
MDAPRLNWGQGIHKFFITDDNSARNKEWEAIFDRLIELRERHGIPLGLMIQVDTLCHRIENFVEKAKRAGVTRVFIGLENFSKLLLTKPETVIAVALRGETEPRPETSRRPTTKKRQNKITEYRAMLLARKAQEGRRAHRHQACVIAVKRVLPRQKSPGISSYEPLCPRL